MRLLLLGLVMLALGQARALAEPAPAVDKVKVAKQYVDAGLAAQSARDYDTALTMYAKAYELVPHPLLIFNMAQAHRLSGNIDEALKLYARYLAEDPKGAQAKTARELVAELEARKAKTKAADEPIDDRPTGGTLVVKAKSQSGDTIPDGKVMIDEELKGNLTGGKLTVAELAEGRHTVAIEAGGYQRFEQTVTVHDGERTRLDALLLDKVAPSSPSHRTAWKVSLGVSIAVAVAAGAYASYSNDRAISHINLDNVMFSPNATPGTIFGFDDCGKSYDEIRAEGQVASLNFPAFDRACTWKSRSHISIGLSVVGTLSAVVSLIMLIRDTGAPETGSHAKESEVMITPNFMPGGGGASFSFTW